MVRTSGRDRSNAHRSLRDNPLFILLGIGLFLSALVGLLFVADRSTKLAPDYLSEVVLYALSAACMTMLIMLGFILARNIIKLWVERRRSAPFARFRAKLVAALLGMTLIPAVLVLIVGSELIRNSAERWFSAPVDEVLTSANEIARDYYRSRERVVMDRAERIARELSEVGFDTSTANEIRELVTPDVTSRRLGGINVYRVVRPEHHVNEVIVEPIVAVVDPIGPKSLSETVAGRLAAEMIVGRNAGPQVVPLGEGIEVVSVAAVIQGSLTNEVAGVLVASDAVTESVAFHSRRISGAYETYSQLRVLSRPLAGVYLSFFVMITLMILISATWMGVYVAKRITRPVRLLADGAREIGAGHLEHRIEPQSADEFGSLVDAFNTMAGELSANRQKLELSRRDLERKNSEGEERRQYIETILERIATGVVSTDSDGHVSTINRAAMRLLSLDRSVVGEAATTVFARQDLQPLAAILTDARSDNGPRAAQEVALGKEGHEVHLAVAATTLPTEAVGVNGTVMVFDDVTPLIRAQRVATWRDVARRLAHEIKNPLTPIQLCAERIRRHFSGSKEVTQKVVDECTTTIVGEVESLKSLVEEFSQFARMPSPLTVPADLNSMVVEALGLYEGLFQNIVVKRSLSDAVPLFRFDPEQVRRVVINLVDNAVDALGVERSIDSNERRGLITVGTEHDGLAGVVRLTIRDNGPGVRTEDREKLFMPYFSTKRRGSGLGLAIVQRIVVEHGGTITVGGNQPTGTTVIVELPYRAGRAEETM